MQVIIVNGPGGAGKALTNDTILPTPTGPRAVKDIKVGDFLFDRIGKPTRVLGVFPQGEQEVYEVSFKDGRKVKCSKDHLWNIHKQSWHRESSKDKFIPYSTQDILKEGVKIDDRAGYRFSIQCSEAVSYKEKTLDIPPYVFGAFLGDGCCTQRILTLSSNDLEIVNRINELLGNNGYKKIEENGYSWQFYCSNNQYNSNNVKMKYFQTKTFFEKYKNNICQYSYNKSIPDDYKYSSLEQRYELIRGLMDTDGSIDNKGRICFTSASYQLILDVKEILGSLGYVSTIHEDNRKNKYTQSCYQLNINIDNKEKEKLFFLSRKKDKAKNLPKSTFNYQRTRIVNIKSLNYKAPMTCFLVDNEEHLFLANDFVVTHNTTFENFVYDYGSQQGYQFYITSMVSFVKQEAEKLGWRGGKSKEDRRFLSDLKDALTRWNDSPFQDIINTINKCENQKLDFIFIDAREAEDIERIKENCPNVTTLLVKQPSCDLQTYGNHADDGVFNIQYDWVIENSGSIEDLKAAAEVWFERFLEEGELIKLVDEGVFDRN